MASSPSHRAAAALALLLAATAACSGEEDSAGPEIGADVEDVAEPPGADEEPFEDDDADAEDSALVGQTVTVSGEITDVLAPGAIRVGGADGRDSVVVLSAPFASFEALGLEDPEQLADSGAVLQVTGTVRQLLVEPFEEEFGIEYDAETFAPLEGANVIVADAVSTLAGEQITLAGEVEEVLGAAAFRLDGSGWTVVVLDGEAAAVKEGDLVQVQGEVSRLDVAEMQEEMAGLPADDYEQYDGELVLVAETVSPFTPVGP